MMMTTSTTDAHNNNNYNNNNNVLKEGAHVEVSIEEEGFRGSWYSATIIPFQSNKKNKKRNNNNNKKKKNNSNKDVVFVEFDHLLTSAEEQKPLRELVDVILVRPIPPRDSNRRFQVSDEVDAFHSDGWWEGIVISVLDHGLRYSVFFRASREQIDFPLSHLRLHREWVRGYWVPPLEPQQVEEQADENYAAK